MLFTHLAPRKRAPKRVAEGGASNIHDQAGTGRCTNDGKGEDSLASISFSERATSDLLGQLFSQCPVILTAVRITGPNLGNAP